MKKERRQLIRQLNLLEDQHKAKCENPAACTDCYFAKSIREIGKKLGGESEEPKNQVLSIRKYADLKRYGFLDIEIANLVQMKPRALYHWKNRENIDDVSIKKIVKAKKEKAKTDRQAKVTITTQQYIDLKNYGFFDSEISDFLNVTTTKFWRWKFKAGLTGAKTSELRNNLKESQESKKPKITINIKQYNDLQVYGFLEYEIAELLEISASKLWRWKTAAGEPSLKYAEYFKRLTVEMYATCKEYGMTDKAVAEMHGMRKDQLIWFKRVNGLLEMRNRKS